MVQFGSNEQHLCFHIDFGFFFSFSQCTFAILRLRMDGGDGLVKWDDDVVRSSVCLLG